MNSCNTDIFFSNYYHLQSVRFEFILMPVVFTHTYLAPNFYFLCRNFKASSKIMRKKNWAIFLGNLEELAIVKSPYCHWSLLQLASIVIRVRGIVCVVSSIVQLLKTSRPE